MKVSQVCRIISLLINSQKTLFANGQTHLSYSQPISSHAFSRVLNLRPALNLQGHMIGSFHCLLRLRLTKEIPLFFFLMGLKYVMVKLSVDTITIIFSNYSCKIQFFTISFLFLEYDDSCTKGKRWLEWGPWCQGEHISFFFIVYFLTFNPTDLLCACNHRVPQVFPDLQERWGLR